MTKQIYRTQAGNCSSIGASALQIARNVAAGVWTAQQVADEHLARIDEVNPRLNAVVVPLAGSARREAAQCDARLARGEPPRPLEGVPITIKEAFHVAATASTMGLTTRAQQMQPADGLPVSVLRRAGAVILAKTNVPQLMMWHETDNPLYGRTNHPDDANRTCGGSSGGEAAIVAAGGSALGLGSDLGGSLRIPAHFCGCTTLMPTPGSITRDGAVRNFTQVRELKTSAGFIARSVEDLAVPTEILLSECRAAGKQVTNRPLAVDTGAVATMRIGVWDDDGYFPAAGAMRRAVGEAAERLRLCGATVVDFRPFEQMSDVMHVYFGLMGADGNAELRTLAKGSRLDWRVRRMLRYGRIPGRLRPALAAILRRANRGQLAGLLLATGRKSSPEVDSLVERCQALRQAALGAMREAGIDALLSPPHALAAFPHGLGMEFLPAASYSFVMNLLGLPAGCVPVTTVRETDVSGAGGRDPLERLAARSQQGSPGLPVGVQVAALPHCEATVLSVMAALEIRAAA